MKAHTPGPWKDAGLIGGHIEVQGTLQCGATTTIARVWFVNDMRAQDDPGYGNEVRANAQLIAQAPALLEACKGLMYLFVPSRHPMTEEQKAAFKAARQAVERADK